VSSLPAFARFRPALEDCSTKLLLDPWLTVGPGCEAHSDTLFALSQRCASLGLTLCVEEQAWREAARDPDVLRRRVDLDRYEPLVKLPPLPAPSERDTQARFAPARSEADDGDLRLLGALHARVADLLVALDGRIHRAAARAGLAARVLTPADALAWLDGLAGEARAAAVCEIDPREVLKPGPLCDLVEQECMPSDPYLRDRLEGAHARVLAVFEGDLPCGVGVLAGSESRDRLELVALAGDERRRGSFLLEPIVGAALAIARRLGEPLTAHLPPHEETTLLLLEQLGFERLGSDPHGRETLRHGAPEGLPGPAAGAGAWLLPVSPEEHDRLLPELAVFEQEELFGAADPHRATLGSPLRKQLLLHATGRMPWPGDQLLLFHGRAARRRASACATALARVEAVNRCSTLDDVLALTAARPGLSLADIRGKLERGPVAVVDLRLHGRLLRLLPLALLKQEGIVGSAPRGPHPIGAADWERLAPRLALG
jgi:hypothetical protein